MLNSILKRLLSRKGAVDQEGFSIWPEAVIDYDITYELLPETHGRQEGVPDENSVVDSDPKFKSHNVINYIEFRPGPLDESGYNVLNPIIIWAKVIGASMYRISVYDMTRKESIHEKYPVIYNNYYQLPIKDSFFPGHLYSIQIQAGRDDNWGQWSYKAQYKVMGNQAEVLFPHKKSSRKTYFDTKSAHNGYPYRKEMLTIAETAKDGAEIIHKLKKYFIEWKNVYKDFIKAIQAHGYSFKSPSLFTSDDLGKQLVFLRYDVHVFDLAATYGIMEANLELGIKADFHLTWELTPYERSFARDFVNLKKLDTRDGIINFGFHTNPIRTWLVAERFNSDVPEYNKWCRTRQSVEDFITLAETGKCQLGSYKEFFKGGEDYFHILSKRFKKHFPEANSLSHHGRIPGFIEALNTVGKKSETAKQRLQTLDVIDFTIRPELYKKAGYAVHHDEPVKNYPDKCALVWDPISNNAIDQKKWKQVLDIIVPKKTLFMYIHPSTVFPLHNLD